MKMEGRGFKVSLITVGLVLLCSKAVESSDGDCSLTNMLRSLKDAGSSCDTQRIITQVLVREIEERVKLQVTSDERISQLEEKLRQPSNSSGPLIAFSARVRSHIRGLSGTQTVIFADVVTNTGFAYNGETGVFGCPVSGLYQFYVTILSMKDERIETELIAGGVSQMTIFAGAATFYGSGSNTVLLELRAGDTVYVRLHKERGSNIHYFWSTFTGHLIREN